KPGSIERIFDLEFGRIAQRFRDVHDLNVCVSASARAAMISQGYSWKFGARHLASVVDRWANVEVARKILRDEHPDREGSGEILAWLREIRSGDRAFDLEEVRGRVLKEARARLPYRRLVIDRDGEEFVYRGEI